MRVLAGDSKTTALEAIALASAPSHGDLVLFGTNVRKQRAADAPRLRRRIGMIFNDLRLIDDLDAWNNVALAVMAVGVAPRERASEIDEALAWVGLGRHAHLPAGGLSLEGRSRLAVARAMINSPELVIADEPHPATVGLLGGLNRAGVALLLGASEADVAGRADAEIVRLSAAGEVGPSEIGPSAKAPEPGA